MSWQNGDPADAKSPSRVSTASEEQDLGQEHEDQEEGREELVKLARR